MTGSEVRAPTRSTAVLFDRLGCVSLMNLKQLKKLVDELMMSSRMKVFGIWRERG